MTMGHSHETRFSSKRTRSKRRAAQERRSQRRLLLEKLEDRRLLAAGPRLAGVQPNNSVSFSFDDPTANVRTVAPRELAIRFNEGQRIDAATLDAIRITRSGFEGIFGNSNDEVITPGFIGFFHRYDGISASGNDRTGHYSRCCTFSYVCVGGNASGYITDYTKCNRV